MQSMNRQLQANLECSLAVLMTRNIFCSSF